MLSLLQILFIFMFQLDILLYLILYELMLLSEGAFEIIDFVLFQIQVIPHPCVFILVAFELLPQNCVFFTHFIYERLNF